MGRRWGRICRLIYSCVTFVSNVLLYPSLTKQPHCSALSNDDYRDCRSCSDWSNEKPAITIRLATRRTHRRRWSYVAPSGLDALFHPLLLDGGIQSPRRLRTFHFRRADSRPRSRTEDAGGNVGAAENVFGRFHHDDDLSDAANGWHSGPICHRRVGL